MRAEVRDAAVYVTHSAEETIARGRELAAAMKPPLLVLLSGDLGSGKTTLAKGIISGLGAAREEDVTSPTFTLVHVFQGARHGAGASETAPQVASKVYHADLYRIENFPDLESLGLEDALSESAILIVEWSEKFRLANDSPRLEIALEHLGSDARRITVRSAGPVSA
ncbi:MAG: tRNA (adenosine(37)-N6)-threonylcarbamoyltransferase complex ATPase subunit type 1 TsaE [Candidatus Acidiferrales bacterium]